MSTEGSSTRDTLVVVVIDDEPQIRRVLRNALTSPALDLASVFDGAPASAAVPTVVRVLEAATGAEGVDLVAAEGPGLVVLDLGLPDMAGIAACREVRRWSTVPILVLSARHADTEKAALLEAGADDYMTKPFSTLELIARVRTQLRRARADRRESAAVVTFGEHTVDVQRRRVERGGAPVHLTRTEWALLRAFVGHPRQTLTHSQLFRAVWGNADGDAQQYLRVYVAHLRRKLEADPVRPRFIQTEAGVGYRFEPDGTLPA